MNNSMKKVDEEINRRIKNSKEENYNELVSNIPDLLTLISKNINKDQLNTEQIDIKVYILEKYKYILRKQQDDFFTKTNDLLEWYNSKNREFKNLKNLEDTLSIPEFETLIITISLNLIKMLIELKFPGKLSVIVNNANSIQKHKSIKYYNKKLSKIKNNSIGNNFNEYILLKKLLTDIDQLNLYNKESPHYFNYKKIMEIYLTYIAYMSGEFIENIGYIDVMENYKKRNKKNNLHFKNETCKMYII